MNKKILKLNIQLFADSDAGAEFAAGSAGAEAPANDSQVAADTGTAEGSNVDDRAERFKELINGDYKDEYQKTLETQLNKRMRRNNKAIKDAENFKNQMSPLLERLGTKYGVEPTDIDGILAAANEDDSYYEEYAAREGLDIQAAKKVLKANRILADEEQRKINEQHEAEFSNKFAGWMQQADELKNYYPEFDFEYESTNEKTGDLFRTLLNSGTTVRNAYETVHISDIMGGAMQYAYNTARQEAADARTARRSRPNENGTSSQQASTIIDDMTKMSNAQRKKIKEAVNRGEKVTPENFTKFL
ncbi:MAG: hypothetical protein IJ731_01200 [Eubacterium sp.]|nr:hypothetical protein [Eubacterium sp.]